MKNLIFFCVFSFLCDNLFSQESDPVYINGDFQLNLQTYNDDESIGAVAPDEILLLNSFSNLFFQKGNFKLGMRYEAYLNSLLDFDSRLNGTGIPYKFASYYVDGLDITLGNYYEQYGSGLVFRSYQDYNLGIDNSMNGVKLKYNTNKGITLKGFVGQQRYFFEYGEGIVRGLDGEIFLNQLIKKLEKATSKIIIGGNFVSRFQEDNNPIFDLPVNVGAYSGRLSINHKNIFFNGEYAKKINDPEGGLINNNYANGSGVIMNISYSQKGAAINIKTHRIDNMDFRSDRSATGNNLTLNYVPPITKQHTYTLSAMYPYATQLQGEIGGEVTLNYNIKKKSVLGGKYGTKLKFGISKINGLNGGSSVYNDSINFTPVFLTQGELYFENINFEIKKKINKQLSLILNYDKIKYNKDIIQGLSGYGIIYADIGILDVTYKIKPKHAIRTELQHMSTEQDKGNWAMILTEYTISPNWFFSIMDLYNYGNSDVDKRNHFVNFNIGVNKGKNRFVIGYGKKQEGIFCVGGVCKYVPSSNGLTLSISSNF